MAVPNPISLERFEAGLWAFVAVNGDVQIGWCRKTRQGWQVEGMDCRCLAGPFKTLDQAQRAGLNELSHLSGSSNPGW